MLICVYFITMARLKPEMHNLLTQEVLNGLFAKNIYTVIDFIESDVKQINTLTKLSPKDILGVRNHLINKNAAVVRNGLEYYKEIIQKTAIIPTGIQNVDIMLEGGLITGNVYEICGLPSSGKTQFCHTIAKNVAKELCNIVYYIDTKRDFSGSKILNMLQEEALSQDCIGKIMSKILVKQINTKFELVNCLYSIKREIHDEVLNNLRLIIIDSLPPLFYQVEENDTNCGLMSHFVNIMQLLAREYHISFFVTNCITSWSERDLSQETSTSSEILGLGKLWYGVPNMRFMIKEVVENNKFKIVIEKSIKFRSGTNCLVSIDNKGIF